MLRKLSLTSMYRPSLRAFIDIGWAVDRNLSVKRSSLALNSASALSCCFTPVLIIIRAQNSNMCAYLDGMAPGEPDQRGTHIRNVTPILRENQNGAERRREFG